MKRNDNNVCNQQIGVAQVKQGTQKIFNLRISGWPPESMIMKRNGNNIRNQHIGN